MEHDHILAVLFIAFAILIILGAPSFIHLSASYAIKTWTFKQILFTCSVYAGFYIWYTIDI